MLFCFDMLAERGARGESWWTFMNGYDSVSMVPLRYACLYYTMALKVPSVRVVDEASPWRSRLYHEF